MKKEDKQEFTPVSCLITKEILYEQVYREGKLMFVYLDDKKNNFVFCDKIIHEGLDYCPQSGDEINKSIVLLPSVPSFEILVETVAKNNSGVLEVLNEVQAFIHKYCDIPERFEQLIPYWVLGSYIYDQLDQYPILSFQGDMGTGKSRCKDVIGSICYKPIRCNGGVSAAAMYRLIDKWQGTLLLDEADFKDSDETTDLIKLLNCGFERRNPIAKCDMENDFKLLFFNPFCPKIVTRRKEWNDKATESRCINVISQQTNRKELPIVLPRRFEDDALNLRNKLVSFRLAHWKRFSNPIENPLRDLEIEPRLAQTCVSLAVVAYAFPDAFMRFKDIVLSMQNELVELRSGTVEGALIQAYDSLREQGQELITPSDICKVGGELYGSELYARSAGKTLKGLGFVTTSVKRAGKMHRKVSIGVERWEILKKRYMTKMSQDTSDTSDTSIHEKVENNKEVKTKVEVGVRAFDDTNVSDVFNVSSQVLKVLGTRIDCGFEELKQRTGLADAALTAQIVHLLSVGEIFEPKSGFYQILK